MWDENSFYSTIETGYALTNDLNHELIEKFNFQTFTGGSAISKLKCFNPKALIVRHLLVKEKVEKVEINRTQNGYIIDTLTNVDNYGFVKIGGKVVEIYEGVICREKFKISPFWKDIDKLFALR